jgi:hypothetical protein
MAKRQLAGGKQRGFWGGILVALGSGALLADLTSLALPFERLVEILRQGLLGIVPALGLSVLNAARAIAFHQIDYFSLISRILVLFSAMVAVVVGTVLLRSRSARTMGESHLGISTFHERETE